MTTTVPLRALRLPAAETAPLLLALALVGTAIAYPLTTGTARDAVTWAIVVLGATLSILHAWLSRGLRTALGVLVLVVVAAVAIEALGLATGFPYGEYRYSAALGPTLLGVPFLVPLAWLMMAWPSRLLAERLVRRRPARVAVAAAVFAGWDVILDPQMVQAGYWTWLHPHPGLPGIDTVPLTNLGGWLLAGALLMTLLDRLVSGAPPPGISAVAPLVALAWMTLGGALAHAGWLGLPGSAAWGAALAVPVVVALVVRGRR